MAIVALLTFGVILFANAVDRGLFLGEAEPGLILEVLAYQVLPWLLLIALNLAAFVFGRSQPARTLSLFAGLVLALLVVVVLGKGEWAFWALIGVGLFNSIMWSNIFTLAIDGLGKFTSQAASLLVMAILGGAVITALQGVVADAFATAENANAGLQISFLVPMLCYAYVLYYGLRGYRPANS